MHGNQTRTKRTIANVTELSSLRANSTDSRTGSEVPYPVESTHERQKAYPKSRVIPRLQEPNLIGGKRSLLFSSRLIN